VDFQNDPLIDIILFKDSILVRKHILKIKFKDFVACQLQINLNGFLIFLLIKIRVFSKVHISMENYSFYVGFVHTCINNYL
jgi:hypothetical protein